MPLSHYLAVGIGGASGAILRVLLVELIPSTLFGIPLPIIIVNIIGCTVMGALAGLMAPLGSGSQLAGYFWVSGFLGGFTTFSAFALDFGGLVEKGQFSSAVAYVAATLIFSLLGFFAGMKGMALIIQTLQSHG